MEPPTLAGLPSQACQTSLSSMLLTLNTLGVPIAEHKTEGPQSYYRISGHYSRLTEDGGSPPIRQIESSIYRARCLAYKKVSYTPRAPIPNRNTKCCMQSHPSGSSFSATHHKSNTGVPEPHHHIRFTNGFREDVKMWQNFLKIGMAQVCFLPVLGKFR